MATFPITELFRNFATDHTPPSQHAFTLSQDVPSGYTLVYEGSSTVGSSGVPTSTLNGAIDNSQTTITTASAFMATSASVSDGFFVVKIDSEYMLCTAGKNSTTLTVTRGFNGTTAASHLTGATVTAYDGGVNRIDPIGSGTWRPAAVMGEQTNSGTSEIWSCYCSTAVNHLTTTVGVLGFQRGLSPNCRIVMVPGRLQVDVVSTGNDNFTTAHTTNNLTTTNANDLLMAVHRITVNNSWTPEVLSPAWTSVTTNNTTDNNMVAFQDREVAVTGTYESSGATTNNCSSNAVQVAFSGGPSGQTTGIGGFSLSLLAQPDTRTGHVLHVRARKANPTEAGIMRFWLYESQVLRSGPLDVGLTDSFTTATAVIPDVDAATITNYSQLELRFQGVSTSGAITPQMSFVELQTPGSSTFDSGTSQFPAFIAPRIAGLAPMMFKPGGMPRRATDVSIPAVSSGNIFTQTLSAVAVAVTALFQLQTGKSLTATAVAATGSMVRQVAKPLTATAVAVTGTVTRQVNKSLTAVSVAVTASLAAIKVFLRTMTASVAVTASMVRQTQKTVLASVVVPALMVRQVAKSLAATTAATASIVASFISGAGGAIYTRFFGRPSPDDDQFGPPGPRRGG
jgi:hypothetical protein